MVANESSQLTPPEEAWKITCHEAGHAIAGVRLRIAFTHVERGDGEHGEVAVGVGPLEDEDDDIWTDDDLSRWQQFYAAGAATEKLLFGEFRVYASKRDRVLHKRLEKRRRLNRSGAWEQDIQAVLNVLDRESIEKVGKELDQRKTLSDEQVYKLLGCRY